ncbi:hypothetical protein B0H66DRAFT_540589 [Apodospora peruviana]|uniref:Uncharacterized protein n=1 Tax=Apodospora peruviana TaxID=516989 RepID=A0AAE0IQI6_9PEZI|nr:hypothetical protein B0H66DRAFT_540589 [Apodospora peruviana]
MSTELTAAEKVFLEAAITCLKSPPDVSKNGVTLELDNVKIGEKLNLKPKSVTNRWWEIKKKLTAKYGGDGPVTEAGADADAGTAAAGADADTRDAGDADEEGGDSVPTTPGSGKRKRGPNAGASGNKAPKTPKTPKTPKAPKATPTKTTSARGRKGKAAAKHETEPKAESAETEPEQEAQAKFELKPEPKSEDTDALKMEED